jgi:hypothetical protein
MRKERRTEETPHYVGANVGRRENPKILHREHRRKAEENPRRTQPFTALILVYHLSSVFICGDFDLAFPFALATSPARSAS